MPVAKHFPGHGLTSVDSTAPCRIRPRRSTTWSAASSCRSGAVLAAGCPAVLVAHVRYRALDPELPGSLSPAVVTGLLRRHLGFDGFVLSDDLEMAAVAGTWGVADAARRFLGAGGDLALICRSEEYRSQALATIEREIERGALDPAPAARRRRAIRRLIDAAGRRRTSR